MINYTTLSNVINTNPNYPTGQAQDATSPTATDGSPFVASWLNDAWGFFQALMNASGQTVSGTSENIATSQLLNAVQQLAQGRAKLFNVLGTSSADDYQLETPTGFQTVATLYDGAEFVFDVAGAITNTTTDPRLTVFGITPDIAMVREDGQPIRPGEIVGRITAQYDSVNNRFLCRISQPIQNLSTNGYARIGPLIFQWNINAPEGSVSFPIVFPNAVLTCVAVDTGNSEQAISVDNLSATGFTLRVSGSGSGRYLAVGY